MELRVVIIPSTANRGGGLVSSQHSGQGTAFSAACCLSEFRQHLSRTGNCLLVSLEPRKVNDSAGILAFNHVVPERLRACVVQHISSVAAQLDVSRLGIVGVRQ